MEALGFLPDPQQGVPFFIALSFFLSAVGRQCIEQRLCICVSTLWDIQYLTIWQSSINSSQGCDQLKNNPKFECEYKLWEANQGKCFEGIQTNVVPFHKAPNQVLCPFSILERSELLSRARNFRDIKPTNTLLAFLWFLQKNSLPYVSRPNLTVTLSISPWHKKWKRDWEHPT